VQFSELAVMLAHRMALALFLLAMIPAPTIAAPTADPLAPILWMTGKTWVADATNPGSKPTHIESTVSLAPNGAAVEFSTTFNGIPEYDGFYAYDPTIKKIRFWYTSASGDYSRGVIDTNGDALLLTITVTGRAGTTTTLRSHIKPTSPTAYDWNVEAQLNGAWTEILHLHYTAKAT